MKDKFDYIYERYGNNIIWGLLAFQTIVIAVVSYN
jgi:hypothetical protein